MHAAAAVLIDCRSDDGSRLSTLPFHDLRNDVSPSWSITSPSASTSASNSSAGSTSSTNASGGGSDDNNGDSTTRPQLSGSACMTPLYLERDEQMLQDEWRTVQAAVRVATATKKKLLVCSARRIPARWEDARRFRSRVCLVEFMRMERLATDKSVVPVAPKDPTIASTS